MRVPALSPEHASQLTLPLTGRRPSTVSAADVTRHCSRLHRYNAAVRLLIRVHASFGCCLHGPVRSAGRTRMRSPKFRGKDGHHVHWGLRLREAPLRKPFARGGCLLSGQRNGVSTSKFDPFYRGRRRFLPAPPHSPEQALLTHSVLTLSVIRSPGDSTGARLGSIVGGAMAGLVDAAVDDDGPGDPRGLVGDRDCRLLGRHAAKQLRDPGEWPGARRPSRR